MLGHLASILPLRRFIRGASACALIAASITACADKAVAPSQPVQSVSPDGPNVPIPIIPASADVLASATFDDGSFGGLTNDTPGHNSIVDDPTDSGHGKVLKIRYASTDGPKADLNQFASWYPLDGLSLGSTFYFIGQVYFPKNTTHFSDALRKLVYFRTDADMPFDYVINMFGPDVGLEVSGVGQPSARWSTGFQMPLGRWVTLELSITMNSRPGVKDGSTTVWINGKQLLSQSGLAFIQPGDATTTRWTWLAIGTQREGTTGDTSIDEERYWDQVAFSNKRIGSQ